jgi:phenylacetate-coenzyme A ligase PaaK-like adenylate-forming protein
VFGFDPTIKHNIEEIPPIPVRLFKDYDLLSVDKSQVIKTMTSSGTTGEGVSKIFLDSITSTNQTKTLVKIVSSFTGTKRLPMLVIDTKSVLKDRNLFSARGAGILGFSMLGYDITYALYEDMQPDFDSVEAFCRKYKDENILIFGFTFMIWKYFYKELERTGKQFALEKGIMIHGGGWKKMSEEAVDNKTFKRLLTGVCGINRVHNYYGMVEQTGSIFMECEDGYLHSSIFSDVTILQSDFSTCGKHETGLVKLYSLLPFSYPGHIILSEDSGEIIGEDDCTCGRLGKYFKIHGRVRDAEIRGCGDTYESK